VYSKENIVAGVNYYLEDDVMHTPSIVVVSELPGKRTLHNLNPNTNPNSFYVNVSNKLGYDYMSVLIDCNIWEVSLEEYSTIGKYVALILRHTTRNFNLLYLGVHFPHTMTSKKLQTYNLCHKALETLPMKYDIDQTMLGGDFNISPKKIVQTFPEYSTAFSGAIPSMVGNRNCNDNFIRRSDSALRFEDATVWNRFDYFSHHPISTNVVASLI